MKGIGKVKKHKAEKGLDLWQKATVFLSLMSWFTTEQGFQNTVFVEQHPAWSMFASFAIQTILLAGVLYGAHILGRFGLVQKIVCIGIWGLVAAVSIFFSYISISNSMYYVDFAVDGNQVTEKFIREAVRSLEQNNAQKLEQIRPKLVNSLKDKGYDVMNKEIQTRARDYVNVTADFQKPEKKKYLAEVESEYLTKEQREKFEEDPRLRVTGKYVRKAYPDTYKNKAKNPEYWMRIVADTINSLNHAGYKQYEDLYKQESAIIEQYNELRKKIKDNNSEFPTLDQMIALENSCEKLKNTIGNVRNDMKGYRVENKISAKGELYSISTANKYVDKAYTVFDELTTSVDDLEGNVKEMIRHSYGEGNKSVDEILALVGNSNADIDELEKARKQMLEAQGSILKDEIGNNASQDVVTEINTLMSDLNNYVDRAKYHHDISMFKDEYLGFTYNIVKSDKDIQNNQKEDRLYEDSATGQSISEQSISGQSISDGGIEDQGLNESGKVVDVTPKMWTNNRKIHMSRLSTLIFDYSNSDDGSYRQELEELGEENYKQQKIFLDTSESDKALGLLFGNKNISLIRERQCWQLFSPFFSI